MDSAQLAGRESALQKACEHRRHAVARRAGFWAPAYPVSGRTENALTFKGEIKENKTTEDKRYHRWECHHGAFARTMALTTTVHAEKATASDLTAGNA